MIELRLIDGRAVRRQHLSNADNLIMKNNVVITKICSGCGEKKPISEFPIKKKRFPTFRSGDYITSLCIGCRQISAMEQSINRCKKSGKLSKSNPLHPRSYIESRITTTNSVPSIKCNHCGLYKPTIDFPAHREKLKDGSHRRRKRGTCISCYTNMTGFNSLLREFRKRFGEKSEKTVRLISVGFSGEWRELRSLLKKSPKKNLNHSHPWRKANTANVREKLFSKSEDFA